MIKPTPNPASGMIALDYTLVEDAPLLLELYDSRGALVSTLVDAPARHGSYRYLLDLTSYPGGNYQVVLRSGRDLLAAELRVVR